MTREEIKAVLQTSDLLRGLDEESLGHLVKVAQTREFRAGDPLFYEGDPGGRIYFVVSGAISIERVGDRDVPVQIALRRSHSSIGELTAFEDSTRSADARAAEDSQVVILDAKHVVECVESSPQVALQVIRALCRKLRESVDWKLSHGGNDPLSVRVAKALLEEGRASGEKRPEVGILLSAKLTQRELGLRAGGTREAINRVLADFRADGIVDSVGSRICIKTVKGLKQRAGEA